MPDTYTVVGLQLPASPDFSQSNFLIGELQETEQADSTQAPCVFEPGQQDNPALVATDH